ncbi:MAG: MotA/TolQ/ExbB proton channel family protein [Akkermansiaceae bacterium]
MHLIALTTSEAILEFLQKGGVFIWPLIICSVAGLTAIGFKLMSLARSRIVPETLVRELENISSEDSETAIQNLRSGNSTLARLGTVAINHHGHPVSEISRAVEASAREEVVKMHAGIGVLDVVITVAPLLGLLGTASGLVTIFQGLGDTNDNIIIARGIAEALNTTIFGLSVAVPCVIAQSYFVRRIERLTARLEGVMAPFISSCSRTQTLAD